MSYQYIINYLISFTDNTTSLTPFDDLLSATLSPSLNYLAAVNDTLIQQYYSEIFYIIDELVDVISQNIR